MLLKIFVGCSVLVELGTRLLYFFRSAMVANDIGGECAGRRNDTLLPDLVVNVYALPLRGGGCKYQAR